MATASVRQKTQANDISVAGSLQLQQEYDQSGILHILGIKPQVESEDYVKNKTQFHLHTLLTEQRHPATWTLSETIKTSTLEGLVMLNRVDEDIVNKLDELRGQPQLLEQASKAIAKAILEKKRIYIYGCGATGRLAKQMESSFWRPFWRRIKTDRKIWTKLSRRLQPDIENSLTGEMTGADRALISSLEGFEDLMLIGRLQLEDHGLKRGDVIICVTEGGETSSVIGTIIRAHEQWKEAAGYDSSISRQYLYFIYNNPDDRLKPFERSRLVVDEPGITKINLTTGPQAITGSTRMQATTIETYVVCRIIEAGVIQALGSLLSAKEMARLGLPTNVNFSQTLGEFKNVFAAVHQALPSLASLTDLEARTYFRSKLSTYFAVKGLITVFIDNTERSPTFRLFPLDTVREAARKCWVQVWTAASSQQEAWQAFLGRPFRGLKSDYYRKPFEDRVDDPYLKKAALESLTRAGDDQQYLYDFSFSGGNWKSRAPVEGDLGVIVCLPGEENEFFKAGSYFQKFIRLFSEAQANLGIIFITRKTRLDFDRFNKDMFNLWSGAGQLVLVPVFLPPSSDPFSLNDQIAAKMILNIHSTAVMAKLGRIIGNTMTNVSPSNLKLVGRATYLIQSHVNDVINRLGWQKRYNLPAPVSYAEANAVLYDAISFLKGKTQEAGQTAEVAFAIIRILESIRRRVPLTHEETLSIVREVGLADYLNTISQ